MAEVLKPMQSTMFSFAANANLAARRPQTPPYTPSRSKIRFERGDSPAPSIHPTETVSPEKPSPSQRAATEDTVVVRELNEVEASSLPDADLVYPRELEERSDRDDASDSEGRSEEEDGASDDADVGPSVSGFARRFARMHCDDNSEEARMQRSRRKRRNGKRAGQRVYKRTHSTSIDSDSDVTDLDAMDDHDLSRSARRLRRKVEEEHGTDGYDDVAATPVPDKRSYRSDADISPSARAGKKYSTPSGSSTSRRGIPRPDDSSDDDMELVD